MSTSRPAGGFPWIGPWMGLALICALAASAPPAEAKGFKLPHFKRHEPKPKVSRVDEVTLAVTADEPGANRRALRAAAETTLADGYDRFEVVSDIDNVPIAFPGQSRKTLTIFVKMSRAPGPPGPPANIYDARELLKPPPP